MNKEKTARQELDKFQNQGQTARKGPEDFGNKELTKRQRLENVRTGKRVENLGTRSKSLEIE